MGEIKLSREFEAIIQRHLDSGQYDNAADVISAGLALLDALQFSPDELSREINEAFDDGSDDISLDEAFDHIEKLHLRRVRARS